MLRNSVVYQDGMGIIFRAWEVQYNLRDLGLPDFHSIEIGVEQNFASGVGAREGFVLY